MRGQYMLYVDQYGSCHHATSVKALRESVGGGRIGKMYRDKKDGTTVHVGYVIGRLWLTAYVPYQKVVG